MRKLIAAVAITAALLAYHTAAYAECTTVMTTVGSRTIICSVCCTPGATCTQVCS